MNKVLWSLVASIIFYACSSSKKTNTSQPDTVNSAVPVNDTTISTSKTVRDGSSYENAIIINENKESAGVAKEYQWIRENYPGSSPAGQALQHVKGRSYDIITIKTSNGIEKKLYFDITKFFGKW